MKTVNIFDNTCQHHLKDYGCWMSTDKRPPKNIKFIQRQYEFDGITLFTDDYILSPEVDKVNSKIKIAWCLESPAVQLNVYKNIEKVAHKFDYVFTYREDLINQFPEKFYPNSPGGALIADDEISLYEDRKTKKCSMILSGKQFFPGHILRHQIQSIQLPDIDFFGWGSTKGYLKNKVDGLKEYKYHFVIENVIAPYYFTEKLIDSLVTGCVPIYYGARNIDKFFNTDGFIIFNSIDDLKKIELNDDNFYKRKDAIKENFELAHKYLSSDDYLCSKMEQITRENVRIL